MRQCVSAASFEALSDGRQPGQEDKASFFRKGVAGEWHQKLNAKQVRHFNEIAGTLLRDLGYDLQPGNAIADESVA